MDIHIFAAAAASHKTGVGIGLILLAKRDDGRQQIRKLATLSSAKSLNEGSLQAAVYGLRAVAEIIAKIHLWIYHYPSTMLIKRDDGTYKVTPKSNIDLVQQFRDLVCEMTPEIHITRFTDTMGCECIELARGAPHEGQFDSGTIEQ